MLDRDTTERLAEIYEGIPVLGVMPRSPAARAGVQAGDILLEVNGIRTTGVDAYLAAKGWREGLMTVRVARAGEELELTLAESKDHIPSTPEEVAALVAESGAAGVIAQAKPRRFEAAN
jgi:S1-C subfamily serine protease